MFARAPDYPDELLPLVTELRSRVKRLLPGPGGTADYHYLGNDYGVWWKRNGEIGIGFTGLKNFDPILVTLEEMRPVPVLEWGTRPEILKAMEYLRSQMILDDLADV